MYTPSMTISHITRDLLIYALQPLVVDVSHVDIRLDPDPNGSRYGLGTLEKPPVEIVDLALVRLDVWSLTVFRRVNKRARLVTNAIPQFRRILVHAPALIRGSLNLESAQSFSCQDLYKSLSTAECDSCGDFDEYLYLVILCFTARADYLTLPRRDVTRKFGLDSKHIARLPHMKSFPGCYSPRAIKCRRRETLVDCSAARQAGITVHGTVDSMEKYVSEMINKRLENNNSEEDPFDGHCSNPRRFMGIIRAPCFNSQQPSPEWGLHCIACKSHHYHRPTRSIP
ncbi:uncharacterized protein BDW47DRAFT_119085 [Aspergillus candidus]|uniref:F-box domain-containing protein n=1 Tax=Aspergillus candidus TaxID=41067 RepID=A0A2I2F662_ASPCN|nr:hypothetical protein BDW47DRAFT_119085 [Aspergillus candidus]PLB36068.1 hypothetical protein BDW47DRAFT_119085 [Aspergillus candidus]